MANKLKGDQNTKFFSQMTNQRQIKNSILGTIEVNGQATTTLEDMKQRTKIHFINLYDCVDKVTPQIDIELLITINNEMNAWF